MLLVPVPSTWWLQKQATALPSRDTVFWWQRVSVIYQSVLPYVSQQVSVLLVAITLGFHLAGGTRPSPFPVGTVAFSS